MSIDRLTFVYDADGTLVGELRYWFGTLLGGEHCSLCDITHHRWGRRRDFAECAGRLGAPIDYLHRDDLTPAFTVLGARLPAVYGHRGDETVVLLQRDDLASLHGDVGAFDAALRAAIAAA